MAVIIVAIAAALFIAALAINAALKKTGPQPEAQKAEPVDADGAARSLSRAITFKTVSNYDPAKEDISQLHGLFEHIRVTYPKIHQTLERELTPSNCLIYRWRGSEPSLKPVGFMAHMDVVPADGSGWKYPPFQGEIAEGYVWGRGALDMKGQLITVLESVEHLLGQGYSPKRDIYLLFGSDEECMGLRGASLTSKLLEERGLKFEYILDEGGAVISGKMLGLDQNIVVLGVCEKGYMDLRVTVKSSGGHASMPPPDNAVARLCAIITALNRHQMKARINPVVDTMLAKLTPYMKGALKLVFANKWLFSGVIKSALCKNASSAALVRTTFAPTMLSGSPAYNVLAGSASVCFNIRIAPGDDKEAVLSHVRKYAKGAQLEVLRYIAPSKLTPTGTETYFAVENTIKSAFPEYIVTPYPVVAATDSRMFYNVTDNVFRLVPFTSIVEDQGTVHSVNERVSVAALERGIQFYISLIKLTC